MSKRRREAGAGSFHIDSATSADLDALNALEAGFPAQDRFSRRTWARLITRSTASVLIARGADGSVVAAAVVLFHARRGRARLYSIIVAEPARGHGIGSGLLTACEAGAAERGAQALTLEVRASNVAARAVYERSGYQKLGIKPGYYPDGEGAVRYEKSLRVSRR